MQLHSINAFLALAIAIGGASPGLAAAPAPAAAAAAVAFEGPAVVAAEADLDAKPLCLPETTDEVVVCGQRGAASPYRLDPAILGVIRSREAVPDNRPPAHEAITDQSCVPYGQRGCPGRDVIPVLGIARKAAEVAVLAIKGEDFVEPLRTRPEAYRVYQAEKAKAGKPKVSVRVGGAPMTMSRPGH
ncbi:MAG: hypothetical protein M3Q52_06135 [Pseudomonadota bacterium]|nr:hypothetical protein [Pseudomonadota bacterium]